MKRNPVLIAGAIAALCAFPLQGAQAQGSPGGHGGGATMHGGGGWHGGGHGGGPHGGGWHGGGWHGGYWGGGYWGGGYWGPNWNFYLGVPWYPSVTWGYPYYGGGYGYYNDPAPAYWGPSNQGPSDQGPLPAPNVAPAAPPTQFRYYCPDGGYYPSVRTCPKGWVQMPQRNPPPAPAAG